MVRRGETEIYGFQYQDLAISDTYPHMPTGEMLFCLCLGLEHLADRREMQQAGRAEETEGKRQGRCHYARAPGTEGATRGGRSFPTGSLQFNQSSHNASSAPWQRRFGEAIDRKRIFSIPQYCTVVGQLSTSTGRFNQLNGSPSAIPDYTLSQMFRCPSHTVQKAQKG